MGEDKRIMQNYWKSPPKSIAPSLIAYSCLAITAYPFRYSTVFRFRHPGGGLYFFWQVMMMGQVAGQVISGTP